jgi:nucleotide-binding universal stress UspA family protein
MSASTNGPIFWALDPFLQNEELNIKAAALAVALMRSFKGGCKLQPVTVISPEQLDWPARLHGDWEPRFRDGIAKKITDFISSPRSGLGGVHAEILPPLVLTQEESSLKRSVASLVSAAENAKARMILVSTQARRGVSRLALGSFCETLASRSSIPVATVNPSSENVQAIDRVIWPTDLSEDSKKRLPEVMKLASAFGKKLVLFHKLLVPYPSLIEPGYLLAGADIGTVESVFASHRAVQKREMAEWKAEVEKAGLACEEVFVSGPSGVVESILETVKGQPTSIVVIPDQSGPVTAAFIGHLSRSLARESLRPVVILPLQA